MNTPISNLQQGTASVSITASQSTTSYVMEQQNAGQGTRTSMNAMIIEASLKISISSGDNAQGLLYRTTLESIYEAINTKFESKITPEYQMPETIDSPETASNTILTFSLGLYASYSSRYSSQDESTTATNFIDLVRGGFEKGFNEAVDILKGLDVFKGNVADEINKTWELVQKGFDDFLASKLPPSEADTSVEYTDTSISE
jgi:hypothetical protein